MLHFNPISWVLWSPLKYWNEHTQLVEVRILLPFTSSSIMGFGPLGEANMDYSLGSCHGTRTPTHHNRISLWKGATRQRQECCMYSHLHPMEVTCKQRQLHDTTRSNSLDLFTFCTRGWGRVFLVPTPTTVLSLFFFHFAAIPLWNCYSLEMPSGTFQSSAPASGPLGKTSQERVQAGIGYIWLPFRGSWDLPLQVPSPCLPTQMDRQTKAKHFSTSAESRLQQKQGGNSCSFLSSTHPWETQKQDAMHHLLFHTGVAGVQCMLATASIIGACRILPPKHVTQFALDACRAAHSPPRCPLQHT